MFLACGGGGGGGGGGFLGFIPIRERASVNNVGVEGDAASVDPDISDTGRFVAFASNATNLVAGGNATQDIYVRDRTTGMTEVASVDSAEVAANNFSATPAVSGDGLFVAFASQATNLVAGDMNVLTDVFVRDRAMGTTERVSVDTGAGDPDGFSQSASINSDGQFVAFESVATDLVAGDTNLARDIFVRDRMAGTTERVSLDGAAAEVNNDSFSPSISDTGQFVTFASIATDLIAGDMNLARDIFVRDRMAATIERVSVDTMGAEANDNSFNPSISGDGQFVAFESAATNLVIGDTNIRTDIFVRDRMMGTTERVSVLSFGLGEGNGNSFDPSISANGRFVTFMSAATNLVPGDTNASADIFLHDRVTTLTIRLSTTVFAVEGDNDSFNPSISGNARFIAFDSMATNLVLLDGNMNSDIFVTNNILFP